MDSSADPLESLLGTKLKVVHVRACGEGSAWGALARELAATQRILLQWRRCERLGVADKHVGIAEGDKPSRHDSLCVDHCEGVCGDVSFQTISILFSGMSYDRKSQTSLCSRM